MLKFLKGILGSQEKMPVSIAFEEIPSRLNEREQHLLETLHKETEAPVNKIRNAAASLQLIVNNLNGAEQDPDTHPKIKSIAKNSLPLFLKAMNSSLSKELPEDIHEFYTCAVENLKGCLNAVRGQGRYLQVAFPEEMKATKTGIDVIGHEINIITGSLSRFKVEISDIDTARKTYTALVDVNHDLKKSIERESRTRKRIQGSIDRDLEIGTELQQLSEDPTIRAAEEQKKLLAEKEKQREEYMKIYASLSKNASHVLRKAEKIANRKHLTADVHTLKKTMELLSNDNVAQSFEITASLEKSCPIAQKMIDAGEIAVKNKEERAIFTNTDQFCTKLATASTKYHELYSECQELACALASNPAIVRMQSLERERAQITTMRAHEEQARQELLLWREKTRESMPQLMDELTKKLGEILGDTVQIQVSNQIPVGG